MSLLQSPLHDRHVALGAKLAEFGGWEMPLEYKGTGVLKEHAAVRQGVGVFDVSHLGKLAVRGPGAAEYLNTCLTNDLDRIGSGQAQYTLACDAETGGVVDDLIAYRSRRPGVPGAQRRQLRRRCVAGSRPTCPTVSRSPTTTVRTRSWRCRVRGPTTCSPRWACLSVRTTWPSPRRRTPDTVVVVCRTGYTGERGYELVVDSETAPQLWDAVMAAGEEHGITACGLGARDTLRTEMGYPLHGQDISLDVTPVQARLGWAVGWKKPAFWGREALLAEKEAGPAVTLRGLVAQGRGIARPGMTVRLAADLPIGRVTSGTFSPTLRKGVALALINTQVDEGAEVSVDVRGRGEVFVVTKPPFVQPGVRGS